MSQAAEDTRATEASQSTTLNDSFSPEPQSSVSHHPSDDDYDSEASHSQDSQSTSSHPHNKRNRRRRNKAHNSNELVHQPQQYSQDELAERQPANQQVATSKDESSAPRLKLDLDLEAELELKVKVKGDVTLSILEG
ncbi:hypothetical protein BJ508DRAFT_418657 [Ascobolus immersus RN42]|uniref:Uncharacterized protein n=1 Tax=Ascobolus immersus RN42 TaxID=1160509 RepID=A0A3N4HM93_ASCIM|nr:hypothetical protein BJ508DRAFT_418657 [Ascobolus immersus RN42]